MLVMDEKVEQEISSFRKDKTKKKISQPKKERVFLTDAQKVITQLNKFNRKRYNKRRYL